MVVVGECMEVELVVFLPGQLEQAVVVVWAHDEGLDEILFVLILMPGCVHHVPLCRIQMSCLEDLLLPLMHLYREEIPQNECHSACLVCDLCHDLTAMNRDCSRCSFFDGSKNVVLLEEVVLTPAEEFPVDFDYLTYSLLKYWDCKRNENDSENCEIV